MSIKVAQKMISLGKWMILTPLQKMPKNGGDWGKLIVARGFKKVAQTPINRQIWSHWCESTSFQLDKLAVLENLQPIMVI